MARKPSAKEKTITNNILKYLRSLNQCHAVKVHQSQYGTGQADISGVIEGRAFQIEVKRPGQKPTPLQLKCLREWAVGGAIVGICRSVDDVKVLLASALVGETSEGVKSEPDAEVLDVFDPEVQPIYDEVAPMTKEDFKKIAGLKGGK